MRFLLVSICFQLSSAFLCVFVFQAKSILYCTELCKTYSEKEKKETWLAVNFLFSVAVGFAAVFIRPRLVLDYWTPEGLNSFYSSDLTQRGVMKIHAASGHIWFNPVCILTAGLSVQALKVLVLHNTVPKSLDETDLEHTCECNKVMPYCSELYP